MMITKARNKLRLNKFNDETFSLVKTNMDRPNQIIPKIDILMPSEIKFLIHLEKYKCLWDKDTSCTADEKKRACQLLQTDCGYKNCNVFEFF